MKVLIWIGCYLIATIINGIIGDLIGFKAGMVLLYLVVSYIAGKLCKKWDERKTANKCE